MDICEEVNKKGYLTHKFHFNYRKNNYYQFLEYSILNRCYIIFSFCISNRLDTTKMVYRFIMRFINKMEDCAFLEMCSYYEDFWSKDTFSLIDAKYYPFLADICSLSGPLLKAQLSVFYILKQYIPANKYIKQRILLYDCLNEEDVKYIVTNLTSIHFNIGKKTLETYPNLFDIIFDKLSHINSIEYLKILHKKFGNNFWSPEFVTFVTNNPDKLKYLMLLYISQEIPSCREFVNYCGKYSTYDDYIFCMRDNHSLYVRDNFDEILSAMPYKIFVQNEVFFGNLYTSSKDVFLRYISKNPQIFRDISIQSTMKGGHMTENLDLLYKNIIGTENLVFLLYINLINYVEILEHLTWTTQTIINLQKIFSEPTPHKWDILEYICLKYEYHAKRIFANNTIIELYRPFFNIKNARTMFKFYNIEQIDHNNLFRSLFDELVFSTSSYFVYNNENIIIELFKVHSLDKFKITENIKTKRILDSITVFCTKHPEYKELYNIIPDFIPASKIRTCPECNIETFSDFCCRETENMKFTCCICHLNNGVFYSPFKCNDMRHAIHTECGSKVFTCPMCRADVKER